MNIFDENNNVIPPAAREEAPSIQPQERARRKRRTKEEMEADRASGKEPPRAASGTTAGPKRRKRSAVTNEEIVARANTVAGIYATLSFFMQAPEMALNQSEAMAIAASSLNFENEFGFEIDGKTMAAVTFAATMAQVNLPKVFAVAARLKNEKAKGKQQPKQPEAHQEPQAFGPDPRPQQGDAPFSMAA